MNQPELTLQQVADLLWQAASRCEPIAPVRKTKTPPARTAEGDINRGVM